MVVEWWFTVVESVKKSPTKQTKLVGGWTNPFEKYARQNGFIFPKVRGQHTKYSKPPPRKKMLLPLQAAKKNGDHDAFRGEQLVMSNPKCQHLPCLFDGVG